MCRTKMPFAKPAVTIHKIVSDRYRPGIIASENRAVLEILQAPEYVAFVDTMDGNLANVTADGRRTKGRQAVYPTQLLLGIMVVAEVLNLDLRAARHRLFSDHELRAHFNLAPLTDEQHQALAQAIEGEIDVPDAPSESTIRNFIKTRTHHPRSRCLELMREAMLNVAADVIHRYDLDCGWVGLDGKRVRAGTNDPNGDEGTMDWSRGSERKINQRHSYPVTLGSVPLIIAHIICPPKGESTFWREIGIPFLRIAGIRLGELITARRRSDGNLTPHPGLTRTAIASDQALANSKACKAMLDNGFTPAAHHPVHEDEYAIAGYISAKRKDILITYAVRTDGAVLCPQCRPDDPELNWRVMEPLSGDWGKNIKVRCPDPTCSGRMEAKLPFRGADHKKYEPCTKISRGEATYDFISILPVHSIDYIVRRFLALQRVEWTHAQFERKYGLGAKNPDFTRRIIKGTHANEVWWGLACLIWNLQIRANLDDGIGTIRPVSESRLKQISFHFWHKDQTIKERKNTKKENDQKRQAEALLKFLRSKPELADELEEILLAA